MTKFKNMKIEVNEQQPIEEIVAELERLGYVGFCLEFKDKWVATSDKTWCFSTFMSDSIFNKGEILTTLAELKGM